jgi:hypothetical protein
MELTEAFQRIFRRHALLIAVFVIAGLAVPYALHLSDPTLYVAKSRLVLGTPDPTSSEESTAIADMARGFATSRVHVENALDAAGVNRDAVVYAQENVTLDSLGTSGVLELVIRDPHPRAAANVANALAREVIETRASIHTPTAEEILLEDRNEINAEIARIEAELDGVAPGEEGPLVVRLAELERSRRRIVTQLAAMPPTGDRPLPRVIDFAVPATQPAPTSRTADMVIGALLGLLGGIGLSAVLETFRPSVVGRDGVVRALETRVLGHLPAPPSRLRGGDLSGITTRVLLAATKNKVSHVTLISLDLGLNGNMGRLAGRLNESIGPRSANAGANGPLTLRPARSPGQRDPDVCTVCGVKHGAEGADEAHARAVVGVFDHKDETPDLVLQRSGFVAVVPSVFARADLEPLSDLVAISGRPLLGVITYKRRDPVGRLRTRFGQRRHAEAAAR